MIEYILDKLARDLAVFLHVRLDETYDSEAGDIPKQNDTRHAVFW